MAKRRRPSTARLDPGPVLSESLTIVLRNAPTFLALATLVFLPAIAVQGLLIFVIVTQHERGLLFIVENQIPFTVVYTVLLVILSWTLSGMLVYGVYQHMRERPVRIGDCLEVGVRRLPLVIGTALLAGLATAAGLVFCFFPGFIFACMLWVALPVAVIEGVTPTEALRRSASLTDGTRWSIFVVIFVIGVVQKVVEIGIDLPLSDDSLPQLGLELALQLVAMLAFSLWNAAAPAVGYYRIRSVREGIDVDQLAAVFD